MFYFSFIKVNKFAKSNTAKYIQNLQVSMCHYLFCLWDSKINTPRRKLEFNPPKKLMYIFFAMQ